MNRAKWRQLRRMEAIAPQAISAQVQREKEQVEYWRRSARDHATKLVVLILHGNPREDEPLECAWRRALDHLGFPPGIDLEDLEREASFHDTLRARAITDLPGDDENAKFAQVLASAPDWLWCFCRADVDNLFLGLKLASRAEPVKYGKLGRRERRSAWPRLPKGILAAGDPIPDNMANYDCLTIEETICFLALCRKGEDNLNRHERKRILALGLKVSGEGPLDAIPSDSGKRRR
jgi:hypothetical protein